MKQAAADPTSEAPSALDRSAIKEIPSLFQPRMDSIAYAPGRSEGHVSELARIARQGRELDPLTIVAFGDDWFLVDGHHRLAAYEEAGWTKPIPVRPIHSDLRGDDRINWAVEQSFADNQKNRLNISTTDKADGAWLAVARRADTSIAKTAAAFGVSDRTIANMRGVRKELEAAGIAASTFRGWRSAQNELQRLNGEAGAVPGVDFSDAQRRKAAKALKPVMEMRLTPDQLAEALEEYSPGIVGMMAASQVDRLDI